MQTFRPQYYYNSVISMFFHVPLQFCLNFISTVLLSSGSSCVVYIDSWNGFNVRRLKDILETERPTQVMRSVYETLVVCTNYFPEILTIPWVF